MKGMRMKYHIFVKGGYVGSTVCSAEEIKRAFPYSIITGNYVDVFGMGRK